MEAIEKRRLLYEGIWAPDEKEDIDLFIRRNLFVRTEEGPIVRFRPNGIQRIYYAMKQEAIRAGHDPRFLVLKYRRGGISTWEQAESYHRVCSHEGQHAVTLAHDQETTESIFEISTLFYENMDPIRRPGRRAKNKRELYFPSLRSRFYVGTAGTKGFGRGATVQRVHGSEVAQWPGSIHQVKQLLAGITQAARRGEVVLETTAFGMGNWFQVEFFKAMKGGSPWYPIFLAWYMDPLNRLPLEQKEKVVPTDDEVSVVAKYKLDAEQLKWRRKMQDELEELFPQEYPEDWITAFVVSGDLFFTQMRLTELMTRCRDPLTKEELKAAGCPLKLIDNIQVWRKPEPGMQYYVGADASAGIPGLDMACGAVLDMEGRQCAAIHGYLRPEVFAEKLVALGQWYNRAVLAVEAAEQGHAVLTAVMNVHHYGNIYRHKDYDQRTGRPKFGWHTTPKTRPIMLNEIRVATERGYMEVNHQDYIGECFTFVDAGGGKTVRYEAKAGTHDDAIFGWAIAWQARKKGSLPVGFRDLAEGVEVDSKTGDVVEPEKNSEEKIDDQGFVPLKT